MSERTCSHCLRTYVQSRAKGATTGATFCSYSCMGAAKSLAAKQARSKRNHRRPCGWCGRVFEPIRTDAIVCSQKCGNQRDYAAFRASGRKRVQTRTPEQKALWARQAKAEGRFTVTCALCASRTVYGETCCGVKAYGSGHRPLTSAEKVRRRAARKLAAAAQGSTGGNTVLVSGPCARCGATFTARNGVGAPSLTKFCSKKCQRSDSRSTRRARAAGVKITPGRRHAVFERDGWRCQICGDEIDRSADVPDLAAGVIDHRVPLASGGEHAEHNWQAAHFYCNSVKQDRVGFDFAA